MKSVVQKEVDDKDIILISDNNEFMWMWGKFVALF